MASKPREAPKTEEPVSTPEVVAEVPDEKLVEDAVEYIRTTLADTLYRGVTTVGEYVLEKFFDNDPEQVHSKNPRKGASFRMLTDRCETQDLPIKRSWLHSAVGTAIIRRQLPEGSSFKQLPESLQNTLLPLREPKKVEKIAQQAVIKKLSLRELREVVRTEREKSKDPDEKRGRRPKPTVVKALDTASRACTFDGGRRVFTKEMLKELDDTQAADVLKIAEDLIGRLQGLVEKLKARA